MRIEYLYGIIPGGQGQFGEQLQILPSKELYRELISLPKGSKVGLEYTPEFNDGFNINGFSFEASGTKYWTRLDRVLRSAGMNVVYLEDVKTWEKHAMHSTEAAKLRGDLTTELSDVIGGESDGEEAMPLARRLYRETIKEKYTFFIESEQKLIEKIKESKPDAVVLSQGNADSLFTNGDENGLDFKKYSIEQLFPWMDFTKSFYRPDLWDDEYRSGYPSRIDHRRETLTRELIKRSYNAMQKGRVIENPEIPPMFRGTWEPDIVPEQGLFEIYPVSEVISSGKQLTISGKIEDCLGTAVFTADILGDEISFSKTYIPEESSESAADGTVYYKADRIGETEYQGTFSSGENGFNYPFRMQRLK